MTARIERLRAAWIAWRTAAAAGEARMEARHASEAAALESAQWEEGTRAGCCYNMIPPTMDARHVAERASMEARHAAETAARLETQARQSRALTRDSTPGEIVSALDDATTAPWRPVRVTA